MRYDIVRRNTSTSTVSITEGCRLVGQGQFPGGTSRDHSYNCRDKLFQRSVRCISIALPGHRVAFEFAKLSSDGIKRCI